MKKAIRIITSVFLCLVLTSCSMSAKKINDLTIVQALSVDENKSETKIALQYLNLAGGSGNTQALEGNLTQIKSATGKSISLAIFSASKSASNDIFFGQNKLIVFGEEYAKTKLSEGLNFLLTSAFSRPDVIVAIGKPNAEDIIKSEEKASIIPAESIYKLLKLGEENGSAAALTVCDLLNLYNDETSDIFLPVLEAKDGKCFCNSISFFSDDNYAGELRGEEVLAFLLINNKVESSLISCSTKRLGNVSLEIISSKAKKQVELENGEICFNIDLNFKLKISQTNNGLKQPLSEKDYKEIQKAGEEKMKALCFKTVNKCFSNKSDPFMCARYLYSKDTALYSSLKDSWKSQLAGIKVNTGVKVSIQRID